MTPQSAADEGDRARGHKQLFTVGHSNRSASDFIDLLAGARVSEIVDVRRYPSSRYNPQFNAGTLAASLEMAGIGYVHKPELGGFRAPPVEEAASVNGGWREPFLRNYADHALTAPFKQAFAALCSTLPERAAIMCAERDWGDCHRQILSDYFLVYGFEVVHLISRDQREPARPTPFAQIVSLNEIHYPPVPPAQAELPF